MPWVLLLFLLTGCVGPKATPVAVEHAPPPITTVTLPSTPEPELIPVSPNGLSRGMIARATQQARVFPTRDGFDRSRHIYRYVPYAIYTLVTAVEKDTAIILAPGERLIYFGCSVQCVAADSNSGGDSASGAGQAKRWVVDETYWGDGPMKQSVLLIKPTRAKLRTNIRIATDLGLYHIEAVSDEKTYVPSVSWLHPPKPQDTEPPPRAASGTRYTMTVYGDTMPPWLPKRVWDDGAKTYIECDSRMAVTHEPMIYARDGDTLIRVNRLLHGTTFEIDRLSDVWQLQTKPEAEASYVRLERTEAR